MDCREDRVDLRSKDRDEVQRSLSFEEGKSWVEADFLRCRPTGEATGIRAVPCDFWPRKLLGILRSISEDRLEALISEIDCSRLIAS